MRQTITAIIPAKNEEKNIRRCLESVKWCDKIIVMWMGGDKTGEIAEKMGAQVVKMNESEKDNFAAVQKNINWAIDNCKTDWMLRIDADEVVTEELKKEIENLLKATGGSRGRDPGNAHILQGRRSIDGKETTDRICCDEIVAYGIPRAQYFWGGFLIGGDWAYDRLVRFFRPKYCRYEPIVPVHEQFKVEGQIGYLKGKLLHYSHPTLEDAIKKFDSYTTIQVAELKDSTCQAILKMIFLPPYIFLRWMIWHLGIRDGLRGFVAAFMRSWYEFILYAKYLEKKLTS